VSSVYATKERTSACEKLMGIVTKVLTLQVVGVNQHPLHEAAAQCNFLQVKHLMMHGADPDQVDNYDSDPFDLAYKKDRELYFTSCCTNKINCKEMVHLKQACCKVKYHLLGLNNDHCKLIPARA